MEFREAVLKPVPFLPSRLNFHDITKDIISGLLHEWAIRKQQTSEIMVPMWDKCNCSNVRYLCAQNSVARNIRSQKPHPRENSNRPRTPETVLLDPMRAIRRAADMKLRHNPRLPCVGLC